ncbi:MAG: glycerophosphodiester phosphodiesterase [Deltaproteobacteria bacterium]|nr:glycerophosphodiester phosphodiesterase [Deltaproteobacteria bacterium]MBW2420739.1 glycerophosphodiester phosphodiesterase [Deltaproteobacteria bacterium]
MAAERRWPSQEGRPVVIAHRGAAAYRPENTLSAYELAVEQGADMIEIDLHRTRDGAVVVVHDEGLERIGGRGEIAQATLDEVRALDAAQGHHARGGVPHRVPLLEEVLDRFGHSLPLNLEIKTARARTYSGIEFETLERVEARGLLDRMLFSSFSDPVLRELRSLSRAARIGVLVSLGAPGGSIERARSVGAEAVNPHYLLVTRRLVEEAHAEGLAVYPYTVDDEEQMLRLLSLGVDGIFSNRPDRLRSVVAEWAG